VDVKRNGTGGKNVQVVGFLGVGLDNHDGEHRVTASEHFILLGGSQETHERMQDTAVRFTQGLKRRGKTLREARPEEVIDLFREAAE
jgi:hypothetical protein